MSEVQARSQAPTSRGRGGGRGARGGFGGGRPSNNRRANGDKLATSATDSPTLDDDGDVGQLRKQYGGKLETIKELFPDWSDADILYALQETDGDVEVAATRIADGSISQWGEVSKPKKTSKPKAKDSAVSTGLTETSGNSRLARGSRSDGGRGARGARASERARGGRGRGAALTTTNGQRSKENQQLSVPTDESSGWGNATSPDDAPTNEWGTTGWGTTDTTTTANTTSDSPPAAPPATAPTTENTGPKPKTWASMLRQSTAPKPAAVSKPKEPAAPKAAEPTESLPAAEPAPAEAEPTVEDTPEEPAEQEPAPAVPVTAEAPKIVEPEVALPPPEDDLTKGNLAQLPDESHPPGTATAASTATDSWDPRSAPINANATPISASQAQHQATRPVSSGFVATALKATERPIRIPSYQRRLLEQEEAVRMPGNREVDRAAVQFGAFSLNGNDDDIDGDREEAETRAQPPSDSPIQPRASLPPVAQPSALPEAFPAAAAAAPKPATSLPQPTGAAATPVATPTGPSAATAAPAPQAPASNQQFGRFGQTNTQDQASFPQKPYDSFGQQNPVTSAGGFDSFPAPTSQAPSQPGAGAFSSAPSDYSNYYTADPQSRNPYNNYYGAQQYGQQHAGQGHTEGPNAQQRGFGGYNASQSNDNLSQYPQSAAPQSRYGAAAAASDVQNSGHNTPNPTNQTPHQQQPQAAQNNGPQSGLHQQPPAGSYPYGHPYYNSPFYAQYMNSAYGAGYGQGGYGQGPYGGKGGVYGQHQYGMSHQSPYDHSSSPATSGFGQPSLAGRDSGIASSIENYGRAGSAQSGAQGLGNSGFGGSHDAFGRAGSSYQSQAGQGFNGPNAQAGSASDDLKPYGDAKAAGGPSPSLAAAARPGSAANNTPGQSGLPPPQSGAQGMGGYGGYPSHLQSHGLHGNQTGATGYGLGGAGGQGHASSPYGNYGGYGGNQGFGNYGGRQQQGGWGNNY
ncbi:uncharacterized protein BCR38DRAFT_483457 [Pseudomassariella vexata]|uniref:RNA polymerase II degradation factor 1 n=1 Tax=Pseudomassariella vexata TaxID=1141098 RepID=A0A1Y2E4I4_9PEZI|nr:uncharacterized protein BCR38DRAFT_483457 [Pseudomassariella vexata]ORY65775.1 hypothetical protein BCR38DRAFT_483457 [Pseudomassariella vexata]